MKLLENIKTKVPRIDTLAISIMGVAVLFAFAVYLKTTTHWRYSFIPDQTAFYVDAQRLAFESEFSSGWAFVRGVIVNPRGVYGKFHCADTAWKALFMRIFGPNAFGWRISSVFFGLAGAIVMLLVARKMTNGLYLASFAMLLMLFSPPYYAMSHLGYNNIHCIPFMLIPMLLTLRDPDVRKARLWFFVGLTRGLCFYTFTAGLIYGLWDVVFLLSGILFRNRSIGFPRRVRTGVACGALYLTGLALCIAPTVIQTGYYTYLVGSAGSSYSRDLHRLLELFYTALLLPVTYDTYGHGSQGSYWGIGGFLVVVGWLLSLLPGRILNRFGAVSPAISWRYLLRITVIVTLLAMIALSISGHIYLTRGFVLIPLFVLSAVLIIVPFYRRWPRAIGVLCLVLLAWEGVRCLYIQQRSMGGVWQPSRIFCVAGTTDRPILYVTGEMEEWQDIKIWPEIYGFADRYRSAPTAESLRPGEITVEDEKPIGICDCDLPSSGVDFFGRKVIKQGHGY